MFIPKSECAIQLPFAQSQDPMQLLSADSASETLEPQINDRWRQSNITDSTSEASFIWACQNQHINQIVNIRNISILCLSVNEVTSWKKLLWGYRLLRAIRRDVGATASLLESFDAVSSAVKISYNAQTTQGLPTWSCSDLDLPRNSTRKRLKCHSDWAHTGTKKTF